MSARAQRSADWAKSPSKAIHICALCSCTAPDLHCSRHIALSAPDIPSTTCVVGLLTANASAVTTKPPSLSPIASLESSGRPGNTNDPSTAIGARPRNRDEFLPPQTLRSRNNDHDQRIGPRRGKADNNRGP